MRKLLACVPLLLATLATAQTGDERPSGQQGADVGAEAEARETDALATGIDAYIYGYPLVTMELTRRVSTNVAAPEARRAPMGQRCPPGSAKHEAGSPRQA